MLVELAVSIAVGWFFVHRQFSLAAPMLPVDLFRRPVFALSVATAICAHARAAHRLRRAAVLLPVRQRPVADPDRRADHAMARRAGGDGTDRRPPGGSVFGGPARRTSAWR